MNILAQVKGFVFDMETRTPLPAAHIITHLEHVTANSQGAFSTVHTADTLIISHIGYRNDTLVNPQLSTKNYIYLLPVYTQLEQIIVNAGVSSHKLLEMPASVSLLHAKTLNASSGISYVEQLNQVPGIFVHQGSLNTHRITIRGIGSRNPYATNRIKAYYNGIPLTTGDGNTEIEDINRSAINTIEILKGSKSAMYGSGLGGVILISGKTLQKEGLHGRGSIEKASFNTLKPEFAIEYKKNKHFAGFWNSVPQSVDFMTDGRVVIESMFSPAVSAANGKGIPVTYAAPKEGYRAWHGVMCLSSECEGATKDAAYDYMNWWQSGWAGAYIARQGYYISNPERSRPYLSKNEWDYWYEGKEASSPLRGADGSISVKPGEIRTGGSYLTRFSNVAVWNTVMPNYDYSLQKWYEFLLA